MLLGINQNTCATERIRHVEPIPSAKINDRKQDFGQAHKTGSLSEGQTLSQMWLLKSTN